MPLNFIGLLHVDPEAEAISTLSLTGERWLVIKDGNSDYRALEASAKGEFYGKAQHIFEDDLLECCIPDQAFYDDYLAEPLERLNTQLKQNRNVSPELIPLLSALFALAKNKVYNPDVTLNPDDMALIRAMMKEFYPFNPLFGFVFSLVSAAIRHRKNNNHDQAVFYYMKAMDLGGEDSNILFNLARVYHELGADERAVSSLKRALVLNPNMKMARQFLDFLTMQ